MQPTAKISTRVPSPEPRASARAKRAARGRPNNTLVRESRLPLTSPCDVKGVAPTLVEIPSHESAGAAQPEPRASARAKLAERGLFKFMGVPIISIRRRSSGHTLALSISILLGAIFITALLAGCRCDNQPPATTEQPEKPAPAPAENMLQFPEDLHVADATINEFVEQVMQTCAAGQYDAFRLLWSAREDPLPRDEFEQGWQAVKSIRILALKKFRLAAETGSGHSPVADSPTPTGQSASGQNDGRGPSGRAPSSKVTEGSDSDSLDSASEDTQNKPDHGNKDNQSQPGPEATNPRGPVTTGTPGSEVADNPSSQDVYVVAARVEFDPTHRIARLQEDREVVMMLIREHNQWRLARAPKPVRTWIRESLAPVVPTSPNGNQGG